MKSFFSIALTVFLALCTPQLFGATGDVGVSIKPNAIKNVHINSGAAIAYSKLNLAAGLVAADLGTALAKSVPLFADVNLTAAQQDTLNATPISVIAAPGAGLITIVSRAICFIDFVAVRNEAGSGVLSFRYTDGSGVKVTADIPNTQYESASDTYYVAVGASGVPVANAAIVATIDADVTSGDSLVQCRLYYNTVTVADI